DVQAEALAVRRARARLVAAEAALRDALHVRFTNTWAVVDDAYAKLLVASTLEDYGDVATGAIVADRVVHDVADGLLEERHVADRTDRRLRHGALERAVALPRDRRVPTDDARDERVQIDRRSHLLGLALELRGDGEVLDERRHVVRLVHRRRNRGRLRR